MDDEIRLRAVDSFHRVRLPIFAQTNRWLRLGGDENRDDSDHHQKAGAGESSSADSDGEVLHRLIHYLAFDTNALPHEVRVLGLSECTEDRQLVTFQDRAGERGM